MSSEAYPSSVGDSALSHNDVITAREQRSHIAIIQMAPPAPGSSSAGKSASNVPSAAATATPKPNARATKGGGERAEKEPKKKKRHHCSVQGCTYNTAHTKDLARHMRKHTGEKPYRCDRCPKRFTRCQLCPYSSKDSSQLVVHIRSHTGDSPYLCTFAGCEAAFKTPSDLTRHSRLHTGEKPYKCLYCDYRAAVKSNLNSHMKRHTNPSRNLKNKKNAKDAQEPEGGEDDFDLEPGTHDDNQAVPSTSNPSSLPFQYACKFCDYKADTIELFGLHMEEFHPESSNNPRKKRSSKRLVREPHNFVCSACPATFISEGSLRCHIRQHGTVPNKPANVDPGIYSPPPPSTSSRSRVQRNLPVHLHRDHGEAEATHAEDESYRLHELQRMPAVHNSVITENPSVIANTSSSLHIPVPQPVQGPGNIVQHHHYDPDTGHMYVITYNNIEGGEEAGPANANYFMEN